MNSTLVEELLHPDTLEATINSMSDDDVNILIDSADRVDIMLVKANELSNIQRSRKLCIASLEARGQQVTSSLSLCAFIRVSSHPLLIHHVYHLTLVVTMHHTSSESIMCISSAVVCRFVSHQKIITIQWISNTYLITPLHHHHQIMKMSLFSIA